MKSRTRLLLLSAVAIVLVAFVLLKFANDTASDAKPLSAPLEPSAQRPAPRSSEPTEPLAPKAKGPGALGALIDKPLPAYQTELLDLAAKAALTLPVNPFIKNRSLALETAVSACLELGQPLRALGYAEQIDNWRRGAAFADIAFYCAQRGEPAAGRRYLDLARRVAESAMSDDDSQDWEIQRIRSKMEGAQAALENPHSAPPAAIGSGSGIDRNSPAAVAAARIEPAQFDEQFIQLDSVVATGDLEHVSATLDTFAQLFGRYYQDEKRRAQLENRIRSASIRLPLMVRIDLQTQLVGFAAAHGDYSKAMELAEEAREIVERKRWTAEDHIPLLARLAKLYYSAGDERRARDRADAALALFEAEGAGIADVFRAGALRPLAEVYHHMKDWQSALQVYRRAVDEGVANANPRPRAEDLSATCCSMALNAVEPDSALRAKMFGIYDGLKTSW